MTQNPGSGIEEAAARLAESLESVRREKAEAPEAERRLAFQRTLDDALGSLPAESAGRIVDAVRHRLVDDARGRERKVAELEVQLQKLRTERETLVAERDRLAQENERLRSQSSTPGAAAPSPAQAGDEVQMDAIRDALLRVSKGENVAPESLDLPPSQQRVFGLFRAVLDFALKYELGLNLLLAEFKIGPAGDADTKVARGLQEVVRERFRACLENREGSVAGLTEALERNARFLIDLNKAYQASLYEGNRSVLGELDFHEAAEKHKRALIGTDYEAAWKALTRSHADLANLSRGELWERFFFQPFRDRLADYLEGN